MTNIRFLGTGTLGSIRPKNKLSKEYRRFSTLLIDEKILIDPSEDIFEFQETYQFGEILDSVRDVLITHSHLDHFSISTLERLAERGPIHIYGTKYIGEGLFGTNGIIFHEIFPFSRFNIAGYDIIPLPANHITENHGETVLNYLIMGEKNIFYGIDGAFINPYAFEVLREVKLNVCILECTLACEKYSENAVQHNNIDMVMAIRETMLRAKCADESTKFIITHIPTDKKRSIRDELLQRIGEEPIRLAYDGYYIGM